MRDLCGLKICFVAGTLGQGGSERQLYYMLQALLQEGARPRVLCLTRGEYWEMPIRELGVTVTWVGQSPSRIRRLRQIIDALRNDPPQIVQSQHFYTNIYATAAARWLGLQEIGALRSNGISEVGANQAAFGRVSLHSPRMIAANSRAGIDNAVTLGVHRSRMHFLPNVVDTARFRTPSRQPNGAVRLLTVGRMVRAKRFDRFIRVLADVRRRSRISVRGMIVGDGEERRQLELLAQQAELLPDALEFRGMESTVAPVYRAADVLLLTSDWEGTPNVILEAMASGLPVIATRVGGVPEVIVDSETGHLFEPNDEGSFADAVLDLVHDRAKREAYGERARAFVERYHAIPRLAFELHNMYDAVLHRECA